MLGNPKCIAQWSIVAVAIGLVCASTALAKKPPPSDGDDAGYTIEPFLTPLPPPNFESHDSDVWGINDWGDAVGVEHFRKELPDGSHETIRWGLHLDMETGGYTPLQDCHTAMGVNNLNEIVGRRYRDERLVPAFWKAPSAAPFDLPLLSGDSEGWASGINDAGIIVGVSKDDGSEGVGVIWRIFVDQHGVTVDGPLPLPPLDGHVMATWGSDLDELIDGSFQVSGYSRGENGVREAVVWTLGINDDDTLALPGMPVGVGTLGLSDPSESYANGINTVGDVCGMSDGMPFVAPAGQTAQPLPVTRYTAFGYAFDLNNVGEIVGRLHLVDRRGQYLGPSACLWKNGDVIDLETRIDRKSGWDQLWGANVINDAGIIAGYGRFDVDHRGFLLVPIEP
jgi:hypothetical protein